MDMELRIGATATAIHITDMATGLTVMGITDILITEVTDMVVTDILTMVDMVDTMAPVLV